MKTLRQQKSSAKLFYFLLIITIWALCIKNSDAQLYYNMGIALHGNPNSYLTANPYSINITGALTLEAWIFPTSNTSSCILRKGAAQVYYGISINSNKISFLTNSAIRVQSISNIPLNKWTHVAASYNGSSTFRIYINGVLDNNSTAAGHSPTANTDSLYIGKKGTEVVAQPFEGYLDEIRIWDRLLTPSEISDNMRTSLIFCNTGLFANLKASYTFQSDNPIPYSSIFHDYSLNANNLTPHNITQVDFSNTPSRNLSSNEALKLDGNGDYLAVVSSSSCTPVNEITIEAWVFPTDSIQYKAIVGKRVDVSYYFGFSGARKIHFFPRGGGGGVVEGKITIPLNQWTHVACTYKSGITKLYVNGVQDDSSTLISGPIPVTVDQLFIGADRIGMTPAKFFKGYLDCVRISDFVKTQKQIKDYMYQSIDQMNRFDMNANELSYNFEGYGSSSTVIPNDAGDFMGDAKFSNPATKSNVPVSPVNRLSSVHFDNDWFIKTSVNRRIPENSTSGNMKTDSLYVSSANSIGGLKLFVALNHNKVSDLEIVLVSPSGDSVKIYDKQLLPHTENELITVFDDEAYFSIGNNYPCVSFSPTVKPSSVLSDLNNGSMLGYWTLRVRDTKVNDTGRVYAWGIYNDVALPVELTSFSAHVNPGCVTLNWATSGEVNNSGFDIERSVKNDEWVKAGFVKGSGTINTPAEYSFTDINLVSGKYNYRLKQIDFNGNFDYFNLSGEINVGIPNKYELKQNYPNPFNPVTNINFNLPEDSKITLQVFDISGRLLATLINNETLNAGFYSKKFNGSDFSSGVYFYRIQSESFTSTKKMSLIK